MTLTVNDDCSQITLIPDTAYITNIESGLSTACCTYIAYNVNCCGETNLCLRSNYTIDYGISGCGTELVDGVSYDYFDLTFTGIDVSCLETVIYTDFKTGSTQTETNPTDLTFRLHFTRGALLLPFSFTFQTCDTDCLQYITTGSISISNINDHCNNNSDTGPTTTIPGLPTGVTINAGNVLITPDAFGQTGSTFNPGVYCLSLVQNGIPESDSIFIDCGVECLLVDKLAEDQCSNLYALFKALKFADECSTVTCEQMCALWEYIGKELNYFENNPCDDETSDCGCN